MTAVSVPTKISTLSRDQRLRVALKLDAVVTGVNGIAYLVAAGPLADLLGLPVTLLRPVGAFLVVFAAVVWAVAARPAIARRAVLAVIAANVAWTLGSLVFVALDAATPTTAGSVWIVLQSLVVAAFAALQGLNRPKG